MKSCNHVNTQVTLPNLQSINSEEQLIIPDRKKTEVLKDVHEAALCDI